MARAKIAFLVRYSTFSRQCWPHQKLLIKKWLTLKSASLYSFAVFPLHSLSVSHCSPCKSTWSWDLKILISQKVFEELVNIVVGKIVGQVSHYDQNAEKHFRNIFDLPAILGHKSIAPLGKLHPLSQYTCPDPGLRICKQRISMHL